MNPARSFGPAAVNRSFPKEHWIYWFGPALGAIIAAAFYKLLKAASYETINPGQDFDDLEAGNIGGRTASTGPAVPPKHDVPIPSREFPQSSAQPHPTKRVQSEAGDNSNDSKIA